jgi:hypothetical protein
MSRPRSRPTTSQRPGSAGNRTQTSICSHKLWRLDHRGGQKGRKSKLNICNKHLRKHFNLQLTNQLWVRQRNNSSSPLPIYCHNMFWSHDHHQVADCSILSQAVCLTSFERSKAPTYISAKNDFFPRGCFPEGTQRVHVRTTQSCVERLMMDDTRYCFFIL